MQVCDAATDYINSAGSQALESLPGKYYHQNNNIIMMMQSFF